MDRFLFFSNQLASMYLIDDFMEAMLKSMVDCFESKHVVIMSH